MTRTDRPLPAVRADAGGDEGITASEVARVLGIARQTVYTIPALRRLAFTPTGGRGMRWDRRDIDAHKVRTRVVPDGRAAA